jgi:hypothetical protein
MSVTLSGTLATPPACDSTSVIAAWAARTSLRLNSMSMPESFSSWSCGGRLSLTPGRSCQSGLIGAGQRSTLRRSRGACGVDGVYRRQIDRAGAQPSAHRLDGLAPTWAEQVGERTAGYLSGFGTKTFAGSRPALAALATLAADVPPEMSSE